jgi:hypothetical protein
MKLDQLNELPHYYSLWFPNSQCVQIIYLSFLALFLNGFIKCQNYMCLDCTSFFLPQHYCQFINLDGFVVDKKCLDMFKTRSCMWWHLSIFCNNHYMSFRFNF